MCAFVYCILLSLNCKDFLHTQNVLKKKALTQFSLMPRYYILLHLSIEASVYIFVVGGGGG